MGGAGSLPKEASSNSTGHLLVLLFFLLFSFVLHAKLGLFLLFLLAFVLFSLITHICFSLLVPAFPEWRLLGNVTEPPHRHCTHFRQPHARATCVIRLGAPRVELLLDHLLSPVPQLGVLACCPAYSAFAARFNCPFVVATERYRNVRIGFSRTWAMIPGGIVPQSPSSAHGRPRMEIRSDHVRFEELAPWK